MKLGIARYVPSTQFTVIALSVLLSAGLVYAAERVANPAPSTSAVVSEQTPQASDSTNWEAALYAEQAANASTSLAAPSTDVVNQFLAAAKSNNLTDTLGRTLLINLVNAKSQGLGDDIPTQDQIVAAAAAQVASVQPQISNYSYTDLKIVLPTKDSLHTFGNGVMQALNAHPTASEKATLLIIDEIVEGGDKSKASGLAPIGAAYKAIATDLLAVPVPQTMAPLYLQAVNNFAALSATYINMETAGSDPVRGISGLQSYESFMDANGRVFTNMAEELQKDGILFTKDEPGSAWSVLLPASSAVPAAVPVSQ